MKSASKMARVSDRFWAWRIPLVLLCACVSLSLRAGAQTVDHKETLARLQTKVHLRLGETTLAKTLQELSRQTGLQIQPADYLQERELLVTLDDLSAQAALDILAEGNDWIWYEGKQGQIFMARPKFIKTPQLLNVAPAFRVIVPKDLRRFVGVDLTDAEIRSAFRQTQPDTDSLLKKPQIVDHIPPRTVLLPRMLAVPVQAQDQKMISWATDEVKMGKKIPYGKLTPDQQNTLLTHFVCKAMATVFGQGPMSAANLIMGLDPAGVDENRMRISCKDGAIFVGLLQGRKFSYGAGIASEKELPDPLLLHTPR